jgi:hypothetical protein
MATIKSYTDLEQSKKLAEILPLESADMYYEAVYRLDKPEEILEYTPRPIIGSILKTIEHRNLMRSFTLETKTYKMKDIGIPCWSLAALLEVLHESRICHYNDRYYCQYINEGCEFITSTSEYNNPIDACVDMIIRLNESNLL